MTKPTPKEIERRIAEHEARINARSEAKADLDAALKAAGGLASEKTLRDEFAGQALAGALATNEFQNAQEYAKLAYEMADAMLEARKTTGEGEA